MPKHLNAFLIYIFCSSNSSLRSFPPSPRFIAGLFDAKCSLDRLSSSGSQSYVPSRGPHDSTIVSRVFYNFIVLWLDDLFTTLFENECLYVRIFLDGIRIAQFFFSRSLSLFRSLVSTSRLTFFTFSQTSFPPIFFSLFCI